MTTFLQGVNEVFRRNAIIRGDTDTITSFSDTTHNAAIQVAILAIQDEIADLVSDRVIGYEFASSSITLIDSTRTYSLASDFVRFYGTPKFYNSTQNRQVYEYKGGLEKLQTDVYDYKTQYGEFTDWYWEPGTTKKVGTFMVPSASQAGEVWEYDYEKSVQVTLAGDTLPFMTDDEARAFLAMAARRFKFNYEDVNNQADVQTILQMDQGWKNAKVRLLNLIRPTNFKKMYGSIYI